MSTYDFKFKTVPYQHQVDEFIANTTKRNHALLWDPGTGKTKALLDQACYLYQQGHIDFLLIVAPNEVHENWITQEIPIHLALPEEEYRAAVFRSTMRKAQRQHVADVVNKSNDFKGLRVLAINVEGVSFPKATHIVEYLNKHYKVLCVIDESTRIGTYNTKVTKFFLKRKHDFAAKRLASGTPVDSNPLAAWSQFNFLAPNVFNMPFIAFRATFAVLKDRKVTLKSGKEILVPFAVNYKNLKLLGDMIKPLSSRVRKSDCLDLPEKVYQKVLLQPSPMQKTLYDKMKEDAMYLFDGELVAAKIVLTELLSLSMLCGGFAASGKPLKANPKLKWLKDNVHDYTTSSKVIIWARFVDELLVIKDALGDKAVLLYGETPQDERGRVLDSFRNDDNVRVLVANPEVAGIGLTLTVASTQIFYSNSFSLETRRQSEDRTHRIGQTSKCLYIDLIMEGMIDEKIIEALRSKKDISDIILDDPRGDWLQ